MSEGFFSNEYEEPSWSYPSCIYITPTSGILLGPVQTSRYRRVELNCIKFDISAIAARQLIQTSHLISADWFKRLGVFVSNSIVLKKCAHIKSLDRAIKLAEPFAEVLLFLKPLQFWLQSLFICQVRAAFLHSATYVRVWNLFLISRRTAFFLAIREEY